MTPEEREDLLQRSYAAFNAGDTEGIRDVWTEDLVWRMGGDVRRRRGEIEEEGWGVSRG